ncbi:MAG: hypothetical protein ACJ71U_21025 [Terriglobales bacterium]|jgi:hypothetical protein
MAKKARNGEARYRKGDLWIAPSLSLKQPQSQSDWKLQRVEPAECNKFLALADIALGFTPAKPKVKRGAQK